MESFRNFGDHKIGSNGKAILYYGDCFYNIEYISEAFNIGYMIVHIWKCEIFCYKELEIADTDKIYQA